MAAGGTPSGGEEQAAYNTYNALASGTLLERIKHGRVRFNPENVREVVKFILQPKMVGVLSWGTKTVRLSRSERIELPSLMRRMTPKD